MTCPRCGAKPPKIKYCRNGYLCLVCGCPWSETDEDQRAWGPLFGQLFCAAFPHGFAIHTRGTAHRPPASTVPRMKWPKRTIHTGYVAKRGEWTMLGFAAYAEHRDDIRDQHADFVERELRKLWERSE